MEVDLSMPQIDNNPSHYKNIAKEMFYRYGIFLIFVGMVIFFTLMNPRFLSINNLRLILYQAAPMGIATIGVIFVLVIAGIDLSLAQNMFLTAMVVGTSLEWLGTQGIVGSIHGYLILFTIAIITGGLVGALNGFIIAKFGLIPFIVTLATTGICRSLGLVLSGSKGLNVELLSPISNGQFFGIPIIVIVWLFMLFLGDFVLRRTSFGVKLMAIGNDATAAQKIGIDVKRHTLFVYIICGAMAGLGSILEAGQVQSVAINFASGHEFLVISAAVLGGTSLFGGKGSVFPGAVIGMLLVTTIFNGMSIMNASPYSYTIVRGLVIFLAVMVDSVNYKGELR
jgi:ribose/xylose/arabinose/galactoside ABC-type transport system permease subunit